MFKVQQRLRCIAQGESRTPTLGEMYRVTEVKDNTVKISWSDGHQPLSYRKTFFDVAFFLAIPRKQPYKIGSFVTVVEAKLPYSDISPYINAGYLKMYRRYKIMSYNPDAFDKFLVLDERKKSIWVHMNNVKLYEPDKTRIPTWL